MMKKAGLFVLLWSACWSADAQDSIKMLDIRTYMELVLTNHPMVRQSQIMVEEGEAKVRKARGAFDPVIEGSRKEKVFDGTNYYDLSYYGLKVPTWFGIEGFAGYDRAQGSYFNPEMRTPDDGQWQAGLSVPLGQGLWVDKRRTVLRQAQTLREASYVEQEQLVNDMLLMASRVFWNWQQRFREYAAYLEAEGIALEVLEAVKMAYLYGDRAAIDTLEATIQLQNWTQLRIESYLKYQQAGFDLETFLWDVDGRPLAMSPGSSPDTSGGGVGIPFQKPDQPLTAALNNPSYRLIDYKRRELRYEERWQIERLKPELRVNFYAINEPINIDLLPFQGQRVGLDFRFPLFLRDARGSLRQVKLKQEKLALDQLQGELRLTNQLAALQLEYEQLGLLIATQTTQVDGLTTMLAAEKQRFDAGESSIFIINQRETQLVNGKIKLISLQNRLQVNLIKQLHLTGTLTKLPN
jgi:outer membrane protein TolC